MRSIATSYGRQDPDGALAWVASLAQAPADLSSSVVAGIAQVDLRRALELAFRENAAANQTWSFQRGRFAMLNAVIENAMTSPEIGISELVERVLSIADHNERSNAVQLLGDRWMRRDPRGALDWVTTRTDTQGAELSALVTTLTRHDPTLAASYTERVAPAMRDLWIANVARNYARLDPQAAVNWLGQYRNEPAYAAGVIAVAHRVVEHDPTVAARLLTTIDDRGPNAQSAAEVVARVWGRQSSTAARTWVAGLVRGPMRDSALSGLIRSTNRTMPDAALLALFESEEAKQRAVLSYIYDVSRTDLDSARRLVDEHISLPELRSQAEQSFEAAGERRGGLVVYPGGIVLGN